ncbi:hypothetical protein D3C71_1473910 [compost metagenome]
MHGAVPDVAFTLSVVAVPEPCHAVHGRRVETRAHGVCAQRRPGHRAGHPLRQRAQLHRAPARRLPGGGVPAVGGCGEGVSPSAKLTESRRLRLEGIRLLSPDPRGGGHGTLRQRTRRPAQDRVLSTGRQAGLLAPGLCGPGVQSLPRQHRRPDPDRPRRPARRHLDTFGDTGGLHRPLRRALARRRARHGHRFRLLR